MKNKDNFPEDIARLKKELTMANEWFFEAKREAGLDGEALAEAKEVITSNINKKIKYAEKYGVAAFYNRITLENCFGPFHKGYFN